MLRVHAGREKMGREGIGERRRHYNAKKMCSSFLPHNSEGLGGVRNKNWAKGEAR